MILALLLAQASIVEAERTSAGSAVDWLAAETYRSCDGTMVATTGPTRLPDGRVASYSAVWIKNGAAGWDRAADVGEGPVDTLGRRRIARAVSQAACHGKPVNPPEIVFRCAAEAGGNGRSADGTLAYQWYVMCGGGSRSLIVWRWTGSAWERVIDGNVVLPSLSL